MLAGGAWFGFQHFNNKTVQLNNDFEIQKKQEAIGEKFRKGEIDALPGPYLSEGNPGDLRYEKVDLGIGDIISISEQGDLLYSWYGEKPVEFAYKDSDGFARTGIKPGECVVRLRRANGSIQDFPKVQA